MPERKAAFLYTPLFCEENIWLLTNKLRDSGRSDEPMSVLFFSNPSKSIMLWRQKAAQAGQAIVWDYHVVLQVHRNQDDWIYDFDSRLPFPCCLSTYLSLTFPEQTALPERYRTWIRQIPAREYLKHLYSDRSHMEGKIPTDQFPDYPIIKPDRSCPPIPLSDYWDMNKQLFDSSLVIDLETYRHLGNQQQPPQR
ncbi:MAG: hypothetical protein ABFR65_07735 [Pseudomonadota bacterium]